MIQITFLISGIIFGLTSGITPGPLLTLVISETLKFNKKEGIKVAIAPLITDLPIILTTMLILSKLLTFNFALGFISILGSIFIGYLAFKNIFYKNNISLELEPVEKPASLRKGITVNFFNPNPYIFWFTVGTPTVLKAWDVSVYAAFLFIAGFYFFIIGSQISVAIIVEKLGHHFLIRSRIYKYLIKITGATLLVFAFLFLLDGLRFFGTL